MQHAPGCGYGEH
ncbi:hypothetical protein EVJ58_g9730, partial [Rhodofomes roseus]